MRPRAWRPATRWTRRLVVRWAWRPATRWTRRPVVLRTWRIDLWLISSRPKHPSPDRRCDPMSAEDLEKYETEMELQLYREYRDVVKLFTHVVETERRFYLTNQVELNVRTADNGEVFFEV